MLETPASFFHIAVEGKEIINLIFGFCCEEVSLVYQRKGQTFKTLKEKLYIFFTVRFIRPRINIFPFKQILSHSDFIGLHGFVEDPYSIFYEMNTQLV